MKLKQAIKDLQARVDGEFAIKGKDDCEDMKLGIEALKVVQSNRIYGYPNKIPELPGETPE